MNAMKRLIRALDNNGVDYTVLFMDKNGDPVTIRIGYLDIAEDYPYKTLWIGNQEFSVEDVLEEIGLEDEQMGKDELIGRMRMLVLMLLSDYRCEQPDRARRMYDPLLKELGII